MPVQTRSMAKNSVCHCDDGGCRAVTRAQLRAEAEAEAEAEAKAEAEAEAERKAFAEKAQPEFSMMMVKIINGQAYVLPMNHSIDYKRADDGTLTGLNITFKNIRKFKLNTDFAYMHFGQRIKFENISEGPL